MTDDRDAEEYGALKERVKSLEQWREKRDPEITGLMLFQRWVMGAAVVIGTTMGFFANEIKAFLGKSG